MFPLYTLQPPTNQAEAHSVLSWTTQLALDQAQIPQPKFKKKKQIIDTYHKIQWYVQLSVQFNDFLINLQSCVTINRIQCSP